MPLRPAPQPRASPHSRTAPAFAVLLLLTSACAAHRPSARLAKAVRIYCEGDARRGGSPCDVTLTVNGKEQTIQLLRAGKSKAIIIREEGRLQVVGNEGAKAQAVQLTPEENAVVDAVTKEPPHWQQESPGKYRYVGDDPELRQIEAHVRFLQCTIYPDDKLKQMGLNDCAKAVADYCEGEATMEPEHKDACDEARKRWLEPAK